MRHSRQVCSATLSGSPTEVHPLRVTVFSFSAERRNRRMPSSSSGGMGLLFPRGRPSPQQPTPPDELADVIRRVVGSQQQLPDVCLPLPMWDGSLEVDRRVTT